MKGEVLRMIEVKSDKDKYPDIIDRNLLLDRWNIIIKKYQDDEEMTRLLTVLKVFFELLPSEDIDNLYSQVHDVEGYME